MSNVPAYPKTRVLEAEATAESESPSRAMPAAEPRPFVATVPIPASVPAADAQAGGPVARDAQAAGGADPRPFVSGAEDPRPFVAAGGARERNAMGEDREAGLGIDESLWEMRIGDLIEASPLTTVIAAGCAGIVAGLAVRALIAR